MKAIHHYQHYDVIIVGAGVMGLTTAYFLTKAGKEVLLIDQYDVFRNFLSIYIPGLADAAVIETKACYYCMTSDRDFILDRLTDQLVIASGFSGHGFKFAPLIGRILSELVQKGEAGYDISRFGIDRHYAKKSVTV